MSSVTAMRAVAGMRGGEVASWLAGLDAVVLDCDGVLWRGATPIPGASDAVQRLRDHGKRVFFVTNNSTQSRRQYVEKLAKFGIEARREEIVSSSYAAAAYLRSCALANTHVYVVGEAGLVEELTDAGFKCSGAGADAGEPFDPDFDASFVQSAPVGAVVVGMDRALSYNKIAKASVYARYSPGCRFVATNTDASFPVAPGLLLPGAGAGVSAVSTVLGRDPEAVVGKPSQDLLDTIVKQHSLTRGRTLMVGDRLNTDIEFGRRGGLQTLLVMTGVSTLVEAEAQDPALRPHFFAPSVKAIADGLRTGRGVCGDNADEEDEEEEEEEEEERKEAAGCVRVRLP